LQNEVAGRRQEWEKDERKRGKKKRGLIRGATFPGEFKDPEQESEKGGGAGVTKLREPALRGEGQGRKARYNTAGNTRARRCGPAVQKLIWHNLV